MSRRLRRLRRKLGLRVGRVSPRFGVFLAGFPPAAGGDHLADVLAGLTARIDQIQAKQTDPNADRQGSRAALPGASPSLVEHLAAGGSIGDDGTVTVDGHPFTKSAARGRTTNGLLSGTMAKALALGTDSAGGFLVDRQVSDEILGLIRARSVVMAMGATVVQVDKELDVTSLATGATAHYLVENAHIPPSEPTFAQNVLLKPKDLASLVPVSRKLLKAAASQPDLDLKLREDLAEVMALRADLAFLQGPGTTEPLGIKGQSGMTAAPSLGTNGDVPDFDTLKDMVANLRAVNATFRRPGWIFNARLLSTLEKIKLSTGEYLGDTGLLEHDPTGATGTLLGYPFKTTSQIATNLTTGSSTDTSYVVFSSDWQEAWVGESTDQLEIETSEEASYTPDGGTTHVHAFQARQVLFRSITANDLGLRRPKFFSVMTGVRASV